MNANGLKGMWQKGTLTNTTPFVVSMADSIPPATATLNSTAVGRKIEYSTDGGVNYRPSFSTSTAQISLDMMAPVTHIRFTGQANDTWFIL